MAEEKGLVNTESHHLNGTNHVEKKDERDTWDRKIEFMFASIGYAVGYGNFWRFPFKCFRNGGGAFLIPFVICLALAGIPLFFMELSIGQFCQSGPLQAWKRLCPIATGLGYAIVWVCFIVSIYYNVILAWSCYYFAHSFIPDIPWVGCHHSWNSKSCYDPFAANKSAYIGINNTGLSPSREFFVENVLRLSGGIHEVGTLEWKMTLCLLVSWTVVYFCIWKGIRTTGKVVYVTATMPYIILIILFIRGLLLDGSANGIAYYITPQWEKLIQPGVWVDAASQVFYSLAIGFGVILTFASYNPVHNNVYRDAFVIALTDACTSIFSGFVVFSILGYMAGLQGKRIDDPTIATDGPGLVFIVYPAALATLPTPHIWTVIFFMMLITLGLDSQFGTVELICACIIEEFPRQLKKRKELVIAVVCLVMFLIGLSCISQGGMYVFHLLDSYSAGSSLLFLGICEVVALAWLYGADKYKRNIEWMVGFKITKVWGYVWKFVTPVLIAGIFLFGLAQHERLTYEKTYVYPVWADALGWLIAISVMSLIPGVAIYKMVRTKGSFMERLETLTRSHGLPDTTPHEEKVPMYTKRGDNDQNADASMDITI